MLKVQAEDQPVDSVNSGYRRESSYRGFSTVEETRQGVSDKIESKKEIYIAQLIEDR